MVSLYSLVMKIKGNKKHSEGKVAECIEYYKKASKAKSASNNTKLIYGNLLLKNARIEEAEKVFSELPKKKLEIKDEILLKGNLAVVAYKKGNLNEAISILEELHNNDIKATYIYQNLGCFYIMDVQYDKALNFNLEAYNYDSSDNVILDNLGQSYYFNKYYDKAKEIYDTLLEKEPNFPEPYYNYGLVLLEKGNKEKALEMMNKALKTKISFLCTLTKEDIENKIEEIKALNEIK